MEMKYRSQAQKDAQLNASYASANARYKRAEAQRRRDEQQAERDAKRAADAAAERQQRGGFDLGERVTSRDLVFRTQRVGVVVETPRSENGLYLRDDDGNVWPVNRYDAERVLGLDKRETIV